MSRMPPIPVGAAVLAVIALFASGCFQYVEPDKYPPGDLDISEPPPELEEPERVQPSRPARPAILVSGRAPWEFGRIPHDDSHIPTRHWGVELQLGASPKYPPIPVLGAAGGCAPCTTSHPGERRWFLEADVRFPPVARLSAGWSYQPAVNRHGPQFTIGFLGAFHVRWYHHLGAGSALLGGISLPLFYFLDRGYW